MIQNNLKSNIINIIINCKTPLKNNNYVGLYTFNIYKFNIYQAYFDHILITNHSIFCSLCHVT